MATTRQTFLTRVRQMSDTLYATVDYPDELLKEFGGMVHVDTWRTLLDAAPYYQTARRTVTLDSDLRFPWSALSSGSGNAQQNAHRVLEMADSEGSNLVYSQPDRLRLASTQRTVTTERLWTKVGQEVQTFGTSPGATLTVLVNYTPTSLGDLASDADPITFPQEFMPVLYYETAAHLLGKGGRETQEANDLFRMADMLRQRMLASLKREAAQPFIMGADDFPWEWGG